MKLLIGIDDTDNKNSRGTGFLARRIASEIENQKLGEVMGITRHQLFVHPEIKYTSQNSSACLEVVSNKATELRLYCRDFLLENSAPGSDAGLCLCKSDIFPQEIVEWGLCAKTQILNIDDAYQLASDYNIYLEGLTGEKIGVIGALAAVGLRKDGSDGRFIWIEGNQLREINGVHKLTEIRNIIGNITAISRNGEIVNDWERIQLDDWVRPVLRRNQKIIYVDKAENNENYDWKMADKEFHKSISG